MSSAPVWNATLAGLAVLTLGACASSGSAQAPAPEAPETEDAASGAEDGAVSRAQMREAIDRAPPLERANFWAREHAASPDDLDTALRFGQALRDIGSHARAAEVASQAAILHPDSADIFILMGRALSAEGQHEKARAAFLRAVMLAPGNADALAALGLSHDRLGDHNSAQTAYRQALEIEPDRPATRSNLGLSLALSGQLDAAEAELRRAAELPGAGVNVQQNLALVLGLKGDYAGARDVSEGAPADVVERNLQALKAFRGDAATTGGDTAASGLRGSMSGGG